MQWSIALQVYQWPRVEVKKAGAASPARPDTMTDEKDKDEKDDATPAESSANKVSSVASVETPEDWVVVVDDKPLGTEAGANHVTKGPSRILHSTNPNTSVTGYPKVSCICSSCKQRIRFVAAVESPSAS